jgi:prepilin-type N-terminal cleavage/methylation domain-containing protein
MVAKSDGFTIIEVIVAITILSVALLGLAGSMAGMTRIVYRGDLAATAAIYSQERLERLRALGCGNMVDGTETRGVYQLAWTITVPSAQNERVQLVTTYPSGRGSRLDSMETSVSCR